MAGKVEIARGLLLVARARLLDAQRGTDLSHLKLPGVGEIPALIDNVVADTAPYGTRLVDAALIQAYALQFRSLLAVDYSQSESDRLEAVKVLRPFAKSSPMVAGALGEILDAFTTDNLVRFGEQLPDIEASLARQQEAISSLRKGGPSYVPLLAQALIRLAWICGVARNINLQKAAIAEAVFATRKLIDRNPDGRMRLAALLSEQAALNVDRPLIMTPIASEALALARSLPDSPEAGYLVARCEVNVAAGRNGLGEFTGTTDLLKDAIKRLDTPSTGPLNSRILATAFTNLAHCLIVAGDFAPALESARRALQLFNQTKDLVAMSENIPLARLAEGLALQGTGETSRGVLIVGEVTGKVLAGLRDGRENPARVAALLNRCGGKVWEEAQATLGDRPDLVKKIKLHRIRPHQEIPLTVATLIEALDSPGTSGIPEVRAIARFQRSMDPAGFDAAWRDATGDLPPWLLLDITIVGEVYLWLNSSSLEDEGNYLEGHPVLLTPATDSVLEEIRFSEKSDNNKFLIDRALAALSLAREIGIAAAYAQLLAAEAVEQWLASTDLIGHFHEHPELLRADVVQLVGEKAASGDRGYGVLAGFLELARRGELEVASKVGDDPVAGTVFLQPAWRSKDVTRLAALASIIRGCTTDISVFRKSAVALAIARVLESPVDAARALVAEAGGGAAQEDRGELIGMISDAIACYPASVAALAHLIQMLATTAEGSGIAVGV